MSRRAPLAGWSPHESLTLTPLSKAESIPGVYRTAMQMLRTVSTSKGKHAGRLRRHSSRRRPPGVPARHRLREPLPLPGGPVLPHDRARRLDRGARRRATRPDRDHRRRAPPSGAGGRRQERADGPRALPPVPDLRPHRQSPRPRPRALLRDAPAVRALQADRRRRPLVVHRLGERQRARLRGRQRAERADPRAEARGTPQLRRRLWAHNLGVSETVVGGWSVSDFLAQWDAVAASNAKKSRDAMAGEGVLRFDYTEYPASSYR